MTAAARRLHEACVRLRDNGVVTPSRGSPAPYVNTRSDAEFVSLICAGIDGNNASRQIDRIATGWRLKPIAEPLIVCTHAQTKEAILAPKQIGGEDLQRCRALGEAMAAGLGMGVF